MSAPEEKEKHVSFSEPSENDKVGIRRVPTGGGELLTAAAEVAVEAGLAALVDDAVGTSTDSLQASMARYRETPEPSVDVSVDATVGVGSVPGDPDPDTFHRASPTRMSEEYVTRLESELAALRANVKTMADPAKTAADPWSATETPLSAVSKNVTPPPVVESAKKARGPARNAPPFGKATNSSKSTLDEDLQKAQAKYSDDRLAKFEKAMEEKFKQSGGYDSDLERELLAAELMPSAHEIAVGKVKAGKNETALGRLKTEDDALAAGFETQNEWMDDYRKGDGNTNAPVTGEPNLNARRPSTADPKSAETTDAKATTTRPASAAVTQKPGAAVESTIEELDAARAAVSATRASAPVARATVPRPGSARNVGTNNASFLGSGHQRDGFPRPSVLVRAVKKTATVPKPPSFLSRDATRAKTISEQRLEQDLLVEAALLDAELGVSFKATAVPRSTKEPRFTEMVSTEKARRERNREMRKRAMVETEAPFSFHVRDQQLRETETLDRETRTKDRHNKFQRPFKAKPIPQAVTELRLPAMNAEAARRKDEVKINAQMKLADAKMPNRMAATAAKTNGGESNPETNDTKTVGLKKKWSFQPAPRKPVPDFDALHASFFRRLKEAKQSRPSTTVSEFKLFVKTSPERLNDLRKIVDDAAADENALPETRWPFASLRAKVMSTSPPVFAQTVDKNFLSKNENLATKLRRQAVLKATAKGHYATAAEREALADVERLRENKRRAAAWARTQGRAAGGGIAYSLDNRDDVAAAARRKQQNQIAKETVERVLMENNVYTYVESGV